MYAHVCFCGKGVRNIHLPSKSNPGWVKGRGSFDEDLFDNLPLASSQVTHNSKSHSAGQMSASVSACRPIRLRLEKF